MFDLQVSTTNAVFEDAEHELSRILRAVADRVEAGETHGRVKDVNGNSIGTFRLASDD